MVSGLVFEILTASKSALEVKDVNRSSALSKNLKDEGTEALCGLPRLFVSHHHQDP